jgi:hypothetical protein
MSPSDSEDEGVDELEYDRTTDADGDEDIEIDDDIMDVNEADGGDEATDGDDVCYNLSNLHPLMNIRL